MASGLRHEVANQLERTAEARALAVKLERRFPVSLWARDPAQAEALRATRRNARYLPDFVLPHAIHVTAQRDEAVRGARCIVIATPAAGLGSPVNAGVLGMRAQDVTNFDDIGNGEGLDACSRRPRA